MLCKPTDTLNLTSGVTLWSLEFRLWVLHLLHLIKRNSASLFIKINLTVHFTENHFAFLFLHIVLCMHINGYIDGSFDCDQYLIGVFIPWEGLRDRWESFNEVLSVERSATEFLHREERNHLFHREITHRILFSPSPNVGSGFVCFYSPSIYPFEFWSRNISTASRILFRSAINAHAKFCFSQMNFLHIHFP